MLQSDQRLAPCYLAANPAVTETNKIFAAFARDWRGRCVTTHVALVFILCRRGSRPAWAAFPEQR